MTVFSRIVRSRTTRVESSPGLDHPQYRRGRGRGRGRRSLVAVSWQSRGSLVAVSWQSRSSLVAVSYARTCLATTAGSRCARTMRSTFFTCTGRETFPRRETRQPKIQHSLPLRHPSSRTLSLSPSLPTDSVIDRATRHETEFPRSFFCSNHSHSCRVCHART